MNRTHTITSHGGVNLHVNDLGSPDAPAIILIHGYSQCGLSFLRQHPLAKTHRLIIPDLRGHGQSDKPMNADAYATSEPWANDVKAIIDTLDLQNPLLVGWSMGGWVRERLCPHLRRQHYCRHRPHWFLHHNRPQTPHPKPSLPAATILTWPQQPCAAMIWRRT